MKMSPPQNLMGPPTCLETLGRDGELLPGVNWRNHSWSQYLRQRDVCWPLFWPRASISRRDWEGMMVGVFCALSCLGGQVGHALGGQAVLHRQDTSQLLGLTAGVGGCEWLFLLRVSIVGESEALPCHPQGGQWAFREPQAGVTRGLTLECFLCARHSASRTCIVGTQTQPLLSHRGWSRGQDCNAQDQQGHQTWRGLWARAPTSSWRSDSQD